MNKTLTTMYYFDKILISIVNKIKITSNENKNIRRLVLWKRNHLIVEL